VLRSKRAVAVNVEIMRAFVELRRIASSYAAIEKRLEQIEREIGTKLGEHDEQLNQIFKTLRHLNSPPPRPKRPIGFRVPEDEPELKSGLPGTPEEQRRELRATMKKHDETLHRLAE
jgi:hypothetical protein